MPLDSWHCVDAFMWGNFYWNGSEQQSFKRYDTKKEMKFTNATGFLSSRIASVLPMSFASIRDQRTCTDRLQYLSSWTASNSILWKQVSRISRRFQHVLLCLYISQHILRSKDFQRESLATSIWKGKWPNETCLLGHWTVVLKLPQLISGWYVTQLTPHLQVTRNLDGCDLK